MPKKNPVAQAATHKYQVFLSHATYDKWLATVLCEKIELTGASCFRDDRDIDGGDDIPESIRIAIKKSAEMVVLMTPASRDRDWVKIEVAAAWSTRKDYRIMPILYHVDASRNLDILKNKKFITTDQIGDYLASLENRVKKHYGDN